VSPAETETWSSESSWSTGHEAGQAVPALVVLWCREQPHRVGELVLVTGPTTLGREGGDGRAALVRQRPGRSEVRPPLQGRRISRRQLELEPTARGLGVRNVGRCPMRVDDVEAQAAEVVPGQVVEIRHQVLFLCTRRTPTLAPCPALALHPFGGADAHGLVGESPAAWTLRERIAFASPRDAHVLVTGPSGTGKELVARAIHAHSERAERDLVARSAATLPVSLVDAELFGNLRNYPNPGMRARPGLVGQADGGTLFLDEIGELAAESQSHLLRVLDQGEYHRLGEARARRAALRLIAATNRPLDALRPELLGRLILRVATPPLQDRREDVPLLAAHLLAAAMRDPDLRERFCEPDGAARLGTDLLGRLVRHDYRLHVRELDALLWMALGTSPGRYLALTPEVERQLEARPGPAEDAPARDPDQLGDDELRQALERSGGSVSRAAAALGLSSRFVLYRLLKKRGIAPR